MDFDTLFTTVSPILKRIAQKYSARIITIDAQDIFQEMSMYLWNYFRDGVPEGINTAYIAKGCEFHVLNYLRKSRDKVKILSLEETINEGDNMLKDTIVDNRRDILRDIDRNLTIDNIVNNGFTNREKEVFSYLLEGFTVREIGRKLNISHVMVVKVKNRLIRKWHKIEINGYQSD